MNRGGIGGPIGRRLGRHPQAILDEIAPTADGRRLTFDDRDGGQRLVIALDDDGTAAVVTYHPRRRFG